MNAVPRLFADLTVFLEDMDELTVEGQASGASPEVPRLLLLGLRGHVDSAERPLLAKAAAADAHLDEESS